MINEIQETRLILPLKLLLWTLCVTSFLILPSVQGTTPAYLLTFSLLLFCFFISKRKSKLFYVDILKFLLIYLFLTFSAQLALSFSNINFFPIENATFIDSGDPSVLFRTSLFTQSLYLFAVIIFFYFTKNFYNKSWDKYFLAGAAFLSLYGLYEFIFFLFTHESGDFISNRTFGDGFSGSLVQWYTVGSVLMQRIKSLTGEPSMFALSIVPFFYYAYYTKRYKLSFLFGITAMLSFSSTAYLGIAIFLIAKFVRFYKNLVFIYISVFSGFLFSAIIGFEKIWIVFYDSVLRKLVTDSQSTVLRSVNFQRHIDFFIDLPVFNKLFGVGFGTVRSTDFFSTLLINNGIIGMIIFTALFLYPIFKLKTKVAEVIAVKLALIFIYMSMMVAVPEYAYLSIWLFLGIAYYYIKEAKASFCIFTHSLFL